MAKETAQRVLEEYHRKARQMGRNIDTVTRRGNRRVSEKVSAARRGAARRAYGIALYMYTRLHAARVYNDGGEGGWDGEHCPISRLFFSLPISRVHGHVFPRTDRTRVRVSLSARGIRESIYSIREPIAMRKVNYIMRAWFCAIAIVSNVSRRGILNILHSAIFQS